MPSECEVRHAYPLTVGIPRIADDADDEPLSGTVEIDETSWGGKPRRVLSRREAAIHRESKPTVFAAVERGGRIRATVVPGRRGLHIPGADHRVVRPDAIVMTDEWPAYSGLKSTSCRMVESSTRLASTHAEA